MELMSSLLLCALVAYLPQALGMDLFNKFNLFKHAPEHKKLSPVKNRLIVDINDASISEPPKNSEFNLVYINEGCKKSMDCMGDVLKMFRDDIYILLNNPKYGVTEDDILPFRMKNNNRSTRNAITEDKAKTHKNNNKNNSKKKNNKSVLVSRYSIDGEVYGLKVKESNNDTMTCRVYNINKSYDCNTPESESFLASKGHKKDEIKSKNTTSNRKPINPKPPTLLFKKREIDHVIPENISLPRKEMCE